MSRYLNAAFNRKDVDVVTLFVQGGMVDQYQFWPTDTFRLQNILTTDFDDRYVSILDQHVFPDDKYCPTPVVHIEKGSGKTKKDTWVRVWLMAAGSKDANLFAVRPLMYEKVESTHNDNAVTTMRNICSKSSVLQAIDKLSDVKPYFDKLGANDKDDFVRWRHVRELLSGQKTSW